MALKLSSWLKAQPVEFDDGDTVHRLQFYVKQLALGDAKTEVADAWDKAMNPESLMMVSRRHDHPEEIEVDDNDNFRLSHAEVIARRLRELSTEERERYETMAKAEDKWRQSITWDAIRKYVKLDPPGQVFYTNDQGEEVDVVTGEQILQAFANHQRFLQVVYAMFYALNFLSAPKKKASRSASTSTSSSNEPSQVPPGHRPGTAVPPAGHEGSVSAAGATGAMARPSSGGLVN